MLVCLELLVVITDQGYIWEVLGRLQLVTMCMLTSRNEVKIVEHSPFTLCRYTKDPMSLQANPQAGFMEVNVSQVH